MKRGLVRILRRGAVCISFLPVIAASAAQKGRQTTGGVGSIGAIGPSGAEVAGIAIGIAAVGTGIGFGAYYAIRHSHTITGCIVSDANRLQIQSAGGQQTYLLTGQLSEIEPGERVRVFGKKVKNSGAPREFLVEKVSKHYGVCPTTSMER